MFPAGMTCATLISNKSEISLYSSCSGVRHEHCTFLSAAAAPGLAVCTENQHSHKVKGHCINTGFM